MNYFVIFCRKFANAGSFYEGFSLILSLTLFLLLVYEIQSKITVSDTSPLQIHSAWDQKEHEYSKTKSFFSTGNNKTALAKANLGLLQHRRWSSLWHIDGALYDGSLWHIDIALVKREFFTKFLGAYLDENISWKHHINIVSTEVCKSIGILYRTRCILSKFLRKQLYFSFINCYLNYANIAWASTNKSKLQALYRH